MLLDIEDRPSYRIALVQNESEALHNPAFDLSVGLADRQHWRVELFSKRTFDAFLRFRRDFDCLVVGYNACYRTGLLDLINAAELRLGTLVLHQIELDPGRDVPMRLSPDLLYRPVRLAEAAEAARPPAGEDFDHEPILNWPNDLRREIAGTVECEIRATRHAPWRHLLEVAGGASGRAVLLRAPASSPWPVAVCSLLLDGRRDVHAQLIENLLTYCAAGFPRAAIVSANQKVRRRLIRKLRVRGVHAVGEEDATALDFGRWPLKGVTDVVVHEAELPLPEDADTEAWRLRGGRLVEMADEGTVIRLSEKDAQWVARIWAAWLQARPRESDFVYSSLLACRAYLRTRACLEQHAGSPAALLGLPPPPRERDAFLKLVRKRLAGRPHVDSTISATVAVLYILELGSVPIGKRRERSVRAWLEKQADSPETAVEDLLDIARVLRKPDLLDRARQRLPETLSAVTLTRLMAAGLACGQSNAPVISTETAEVASREVTTSSLAAAEYVRWRAEWIECHGATLEPDAIRILDSALGTLARRGTLGRNADGEDGGIEEACAEAAAFAWFTALDDHPTSALAPPDVFTPGLVEDALENSAALRATNRELEEDRKAANRARHFFGALAIALSVGLAFFLNELGFPGEAVVFSPVAAIIVLGFVLGWIGLAPVWFTAIGAAVAGGFQGVQRRLQEAGGRGREAGGG
jgi:hypothetical protein